ncbi:MAG: hypothetical protein ACT4PT_07880 [Methanobacteriota archaeon]
MTVGFEVFLTKKADGEKLRQALADDTVSRQTIVVKDGATYGLEQGTEITLIEGPTAALDHAARLIFAFGGQRAKEAVKLRQKIKEEEDAAAAGVGFMFG